MRRNTLRPTMCIKYMYWSLLEVGRNALRRMQAINYFKKTN